MIYTVLMVLFSLGDLARISFYNQEVNIYLFEIVYAGFTLFFVFKIPV